LTCTNCGAETRPGQKFCLTCGTRLAEVCPNCGLPVEAGARFCGECGTSLQASGNGPAALAGAPVAEARPHAHVEEVAEAPAPVAERRLVSVLFADLVGFTSLAEGRDAEAVREFLTRYFDGAREVVARYGGTVEKFIGDAVMAVWGAPTAHEDDAERAVRAALDLVEAVHGLGASIGVTDLQARAAVLTGEAAVTVGAEGQGMVAGDLVNTASRLQSVAPAGAVLVGQATRDSASMAISFEDVGDQTLKGKELPVPAWRAVRVIAGRGGAGRYWGLEAPFEGRDEELRLLKDLFHATAREKRARLVTVIGQAGTGKSRLTREFEKYTDGLVEDTYWHVGRSPSYGEGITFWALGEMVRKRAGLAETDDTQTTRERIAATLVEYVPDEGERRWIEPRLLQLLGLEEGRGGEREEVFAAWRTFFERVADKGPVVMAFEDLEFADSGLLDFIDHVLEWSRAHPIFVIALARPELLERRAGWGAGHRNFVAIGLEPLSDDAMRGMLAGLVPGLPESAVRAILARAEGVPLYAVETVRMLLNTGRLVAQEGIYQPAGDLAELEVPDTLHALIAARLDALEGSDRSVLQDGAVLGQTFTLAALSGVSGEAPDTLEPRLRALVRREVLVLDIDPRSPERGQYGFVQGLVREVAYSTLSKRDRRARHLAAARYFEEHGDEEIVGALAMHYVDAWKAAPEGPEGDAVAAQARVSLRAAAERAANLHSPAQALSYLEHALAVTPDPLERAAVLERAGAAANDSANFPAAERYWNEAIDIYRAHGNLTSVARITATLGLGLAFAGELDRSIDTLTPAYEELSDRLDDPGVLALTASLARAHALKRQGSVRAIELADRALVAAERLDLIDVIADAVITKAVGLGQSHRLQEALILLSGVVALAEARGLVVADLRARINISQFALSDDPRLALEVARVGVERAQKLGLRARETILAGNAIFAALFTGDWDWAIAKSPEVLRDEPMRFGLTEVLAYPLLMRALRGESEGIAEGIQAVRESVADSTDPQYTQMMAWLDAAVALAQGRPEAVASIVPADLQDPTYGSLAYAMAGHAAMWLRDAARARRALASLEGMQIGGRLFDANMRTLRAGIAALEGRSGEAATGFAEATRDLRELGLPLPLALAQLDLLATLGPEGQASQSAADEAREILTRLDANALLARLDLFVESPAPARAAKGAKGAKAAVAPVSRSA
jgi:class 3 adenylate cyclase/tetratricopeptide (TPR) repeat protein